MTVGQGSAIGVVLLMVFLALLSFGGSEVQLAPFFGRNWMMLTVFSAGLLSGSTAPLAAQHAPRLTLADLVSLEPVGDTALSPDGKTFAIAREGQIYLMPAEGGWPVRLTSNSGGKTGVNWSPDGKMLAYASQGGIWTVAAAGGQPHRLTDAPPGPGDPRQATDRAPQWSPKGHWILFTSGRRGHNSLMVVSEDGNVTSLLTPGPEESAEGK